jgi:hypothetical protein
VFAGCDGAECVLTRSTVTLIESGEDVQRVRESLVGNVARIGAAATTTATRVEYGLHAGTPMII